MIGAGVLAAVSLYGWEGGLVSSRGCNSEPGDIPSVLNFNVVKAEAEAPGDREKSAWRSPTFKFCEDEAIRLVEADRRLPEDDRVRRD